MSQLKRYNGSTWETIGGNIAPKTTKTTSDTDTYCCNYINKLTDYSPNVETVIGIYKGKPLYRIELNEISITATSQATDVSSYNIDELVHVYPKYKEFSSATDYNEDFGNYYTSSSDFRRTFYRTLNNGSIKSLEYRGKAGGKVTYTIEYTKTTD